MIFDLTLPSPEAAFYTALIFVIIGVLILIGLLFKKEQKTKPDNQKQKTEPDRRQLVWIFVFIFFTIASILIKFGIDWTMEFQNIVEAATQPSDYLTDVYNSRTLLATVEGITFTEIGIFLPLLIIIWGNAQQKMTDMKLHLLELKEKSSSGRINIIKLNTKIKEYEDNSLIIDDVGGGLKSFFYLTIGFIIIFVISLVWANFSTSNNYFLYQIVIWQKVIAILILLWFVLLLAIYQWIIDHFIQKIKPYDFDIYITNYRPFSQSIKPDDFDIYTT